MPRRAADSLFRLEFEILLEALRFAATGRSPFHGYELSKELEAGRAVPTAHGSVYRALIRLEALDYVESTWEPHEIAEREGRPRRRLYSVTAAGATAVNRLTLRSDTETDHLAALRPAT